MDIIALLFVIFVTLLIAFQFLSYSFLYLPILYHQQITIFFILTPVFFIVLILLLISYFKAVLTSPGLPSKSLNQLYASQLQQLKAFATQDSLNKKSRKVKAFRDMQAQIQQIQSLNKYSYCFKCQVVKQPRTHHCSVCKSCIIRMDHHCPWTGNCIGKLNHKYFILFLFYATIDISIVFGSIFIDYLKNQPYMSKLQISYKMTLYITGISCFLLLFSIGFLLITQIFTIFQNLTTLETFTEGIQKRNPWDRNSIMQNLQEIFGLNRKQWLIPTKPQLMFNQDFYKAVSLDDN